MRASASLFAIVFLAIFGYMAYHNFELPTLFIFEKTEKVIGTVTEVKLKYGLRGHGFQQNVTYAYTVNDSTITDHFTAGRSHGWQRMGNQILIEYSEKDWSKNRIVGYLRQ